MSEMKSSLEQQLAYKQLPWELDANEFAMETIRKFWKNPVSNSHKPQ